MLTHIKHVARFATIVALMAICFVFSTSGSTAHAQTLLSQSTPPPPPVACQRIIGDNGVRLCIAPQVLLPNRANCPGQQFFSAIDAFSNPVNWTFTDAGNTCVHVDYSINPSPFSNCSVFFYVPKGNATANFSFSWQDGTGPISSNTLNENPVDGWQQLFTKGTSTNFGPITDLSFFDHQSSGGQKLGWGSNQAHSLLVSCT